VASKVINLKPLLQSLQGLSRWSHNQEDDRLKTHLHVRFRGAILRSELAEVPENEPYTACKRTGKPDA
jgi:hypothetical protein